MNVVSLQAVNFRSWADLDLEVPTGATAILGANGAGKSTLLQAIDTGLFCDRGELATMLRDGTDDCSVCVTVEHAGEVYRIRRAFSKGKTTCDFERLCVADPFRSNPMIASDPPESWEPLTLASIAETDALICQTLSLTRETFRASAFLGQGARAFASKDTTPKQRMALFSALLGLGVYEQLAARAHDERVTVEREAETVHAHRADALARAAGRDEYEVRIAELGSTMHFASEALAAAQTRRDELAVAFTEAHEKTHAVGVAQSALAAAEAEHRRLHDVTLAAEAARKALGTLGPELVRMTEIAAPLPGLVAHEDELRAEVETHRRAVAEYEAQQRAWSDAVNRRDDLNRRAKTANERKDTLRQQAARVMAHATLDDAPAETCDRCGQALDKDAAARAADSYLADAAEAAQEALALGQQADEIETAVVREPPASEPPTAQLEQARAAVAEARAAERDLAMLTERRNTLLQKIAQADDPMFLATMRDSVEGLTKAQSALRAAQAAAPTPEQAMRIKMDRLAADAEVNQAQQALTHATGEKARADERLAQIATAEQQAAELHAQETTLNDRAILLAACEKAHGRNGVPALILENRVPAIEATATDLLAALGGNTAGARVELRTQREKKTGGTEDRLDVVLVTPDGYDRGYDSWSTGERCRIDVALAKAILPSFEFLTIDDPPGLDTEGKAALIDTIDALLDRGGLSTVIVVSQEAELRDSFAQIVELETRGGRSMVAGARELEGATA